MSPRLVYRIEHAETGIGPFQYPHRDISLDMSDVPMPEEDGVAYFPSSWCFAFPSLQMLFAWVTARDQIALTRWGFSLQPYMVLPGSFVEGDNQIVFDKQAAVKIDPHEVIN